MGEGVRALRHPCSGPYYVAPAAGATSYFRRGRVRRPRGFQNPTESDYLSVDTSYRSHRLSPGMSVDRPSASWEATTGDVLSTTTPPRPSPTAAMTRESWSEAADRRPSGPHRERGGAGPAGAREAASGPRPRTSTRPHSPSREPLPERPPRRRRGGRHRAPRHTLRGVARHRPTSRRERAGNGHPTGPHATAPPQRCRPSLDLDRRSDHGRRPHAAMPTAPTSRTPHRTSYARGSELGQQRGYGPNGCEVRRPDSRAMRRARLRATPRMSQRETHRTSGGTPAGIRG